MKSFMCNLNIKTRNVPIFILTFITKAKVVLIILETLSKFLCDCFKIRLIDRENSLLFSNSDEKWTSLLYPPMDMMDFPIERFLIEINY